MTDVLKQLRVASFRGIIFPIVARTFGFQQAQTEHRFIFKDDQLIEALGRQNPTFRYTIPFREDIFASPWNGANLFTRVYPLFLEACRDRSNGDLRDPIHGQQQVKCSSLQETIDVNRRDGVDVDVDFIFSPNQDAVASSLGSEITTIEGSKALARDFDADVATIDFPPQEPAPQATLDPFTLITSVANQLETNGNKIQAALSDVGFRAERAIDSIDRLKDPKLSPTRQTGRRLIAAQRRAQETFGAAGPRRVLRVHTVQGNIGVIALAGNLGNKPQEFLAINPGLARSPQVKKGKQVRFFAEVNA